MKKVKNMNRPDNSRRNFLAKSVYSAAILSASPLRNAFAINQEISSGNQSIAGTSLAVNPPLKDAAGVKITEAENKVTVEINGELFTEYCYKGAQRPYFYPVIGPTGINITRNWPMKDGENEEKDHPHQRSLWYAHGSVNGVDFWTEGARNGNTVHDKFLKIESGKDVGIIQSQNNLIASDGKLICTDTRTHKFYNLPDAKMVDFEITYHASEGQVVLGDTKEGSMALRLAPTMQLKGVVGQGHIINSEGIKDDDTWGKRAVWCDYYGPVNGEIVGVSIFDNPQNPKHPTWWHVRDYGLFAANPFGVSDFEQKPKGTGNITIPEGQSLTFKYRIFIHKGDQKEGKVAEHYNEYTEGK
jgi:hypothetical protein